MMAGTDLIKQPKCLCTQRKRGRTGARERARLTNITHISLRTRLFLMLFSWIVQVFPEKKKEKKIYMKFKPRFSFHWKTFQKSHFSYLRLFQIFPNQLHSVLYLSELAAIQRQSLKIPLQFSRKIQALIYHWMESENKSLMPWQAWIFFWGLSLIYVGSQQTRLVKYLLLLPGIWKNEVWSSGESKPQPSSH